jgi:hypothetical protein
MEATNISKAHRRTNFCCGLQEVGAFSVYRGHGTDLTPQALGTLRAEMETYPASFCTTVLEYRTAQYDDNDPDNPYYEMVPAADAQGEMNRLLPQIGFIPVRKFIGNEGNIVQLWMYVRRSSEVEE